MSLDKASRIGVPLFNRASALQERAAYLLRGGGLLLSLLFKLVIHMSYEIGHVIPILWITKEMMHRAPQVVDMEYLETT
jgi:hypothetical protein